jgi:hypothetical protein
MANVEGPIRVSRQHSEEFSQDGAIEASIGLLRQFE